MAWGRIWWGLSLLCLSLSFWLGGLGWAGLLPGLLGAVGVLLLGKLIGSGEGRGTCREGDQAVVVVAVLPLSDRGAVKVRGKLKIAQAAVAIPAGEKVLLEKVEGNLVWVKPLA